MHMQLNNRCLSVSYFFVLNMCCLLFPLNSSFLSKCLNNQKTTFITYFRLLCDALAKSYSMTRKHIVFAFNNVDSYCSYDKELNKEVAIKVIDLEEA